MTMDGTNTEGKRIRGVWVGKFDGKAYPVKGNPYHDAEGMRVINDHTLFIQGLKDGKVMWWGTITISKDGKSHRPPSLDRLPREEADPHQCLRQAVRSQPIKPTADRRVSSLVINSTFSFVAERTPASRGSAVSR